MQNNIELKPTKNIKSFEEIKHYTQYGAEYWIARELMEILDYDTWRRFEDVINKAKISCNTTGADSSQEFLPAPAKTIDKGGRPGKDYFLSRLACYLIAQNGDPSKKAIMPENLKTPHSLKKSISKLKKIDKAKNKIK